jgi:hypothetical protein
MTAPTLTFTLANAAPPFSTPVRDTHAGALG